jgi:hypothetical protein
VLVAFRHVIFCHIEKAKSALAGWYQERGRGLQVAFRHISLCCNIYTSTFEARANERLINRVHKSIYTWIGKSSDFLMSVVDD